MEKHLSNIYNELEYIRISLRKLGPTRRLQEIGVSKVRKAIEIYERYKKYINSLSEKDLSSDYSGIIIENVCQNIEKTFLEILNYNKSVTTGKMRQL